MKWIVTLERTETTTSRAKLLVDAESEVEATKKVANTETSPDDLVWGDDYTDEGDAEVVGCRAFDPETEDTEGYDRIDEDSNLEDCGPLTRVLRATGETPEQVRRSCYSISRTRITNMSKKQYSDHPEVYATVTVGKRQIKVRSSPESDAFFASVQVMSDPREVLGVGIWLSQMAPRLANCPERVIDNRGTPMIVDGRSLNPRCNEEGLSLMRSLARVEDRARRIAVAEFLVATGEAFFLRACHMDPSIIGR